MKRLCIMLPVLCALTGCATALSSIDKQGDVYLVTHLKAGFMGNVAGKLLACTAEGRAVMRCRTVGTP